MDQQLNSRVDILFKCIETLNKIEEERSKTLEAINNNINSLYNINENNSTIVRVLKETIDLTAERASLLNKLLDSFEEELNNLKTRMKDLEDRVQLLEIENIIRSKEKETINESSADMLGTLKYKLPEGLTVENGVYYGEVPKPEPIPLWFGEPP